jgi:hypothetical protein
MPLVRSNARRLIPAEVDADLSELPVLFIASSLSSCLSQKRHSTPLSESPPARASFSSRSVGYQLVAMYLASMNSSMP